MKEPCKSKWSRKRSRRVIENVDEWIDCIDCNTGKVVSWDFTGYIKEDYSSFDDYLMDQMKSAIENM